MMAMTTGSFALHAACSQRNYSVCRKESISLRVACGCVRYCLRWRRRRLRRRRWGWWCKWLLVHTLCWKAVENTITDVMSSLRFRSLHGKWMKRKAVEGYGRKRVGVNAPNHLRVRGVWKNVLMRFMCTKKHIVVTATSDADAFNIITFQHKIYWAHRWNSRHNNYSWINWQQDRPDIDFIFYGITRFGTVRRRLPLK